MKRIFSVLALLLFGTSAVAAGFHYTRVFATTSTVATQVTATHGDLHAIIETQSVGGATITFQVLDVATGCQQVPASDSSIIVDGQMSTGISLLVDAHFLNGLCVVIIPTNLNVPTQEAITVTWN
jgi:hypothetical protein